MTGRNDWANWESFDPASIPTKEDRPELETWLERIPAASALLDLGCGAGGVSRRLVERGFAVVGVDINEGALSRAREAAPGAKFYRRDVASPGGLALEEAPFEGVVCQLVLSIVGGPEDRLGLLANARRALAPHGHLYLSASGVSDEINPAYRRRYEEDFPGTGERYTYFSRDELGNVLYRTHHFEEEELTRLLEETGFEVVELRKKREASSRRPEEAAFFFYAFCRRIPE
jgi:SAM-dependent methyltransferase